MQKVQPLEVWVWREVMYRDENGGEAVVYRATLADGGNGHVVLGDYTTPGFVCRTDAIARLLAWKEGTKWARRRYVLRGAL